MAWEHSESEPVKRRSRFPRALLIATAIEIGALILTAGATIRSFFAHSPADPNSVSNNPLAYVGIFFHMPSLIITAPLGLIFLAPLVQILLMAGIIFLFLRRR